jgi:phosphoglycerate kinase
VAVTLLRDLEAEELRSRAVLVRADLNVPLDDHGRVTDDTRVRASVPTLRHLLDSGARVTLLSHLGRPKGRPEPSFSLAPVAGLLESLLDRPVRFCPDLVGAEAREAAAGLRDGELLLLENTRFHPGETANDPELAEALATYGTLYVNDAFGAAHRAHASTEGVAHGIRAAGGRAVAGFLLERELRFLGASLADPARPFVAILGGAKISGKIDVVEALLPRVDRLLIGGAMANTFFLALGLEVGDSLVEPDRVDLARELMERAGAKLLLPVDCVVAERLDEEADARVAPRDAVSPGERIGDIGPATVQLFGEAVRGAGTVVWNGPMGVFELTSFREGTVAVARAVAEATDRGGLSIVGGGDSAAAAEVAGVAERLSHVSTGGGASLEFLAGAPLPGVVALDSTEDS